VNKKPNAAAFSPNKHAQLPTQ